MSKQSISQMPLFWTKKRQAPQGSRLGFMAFSEQDLMKACDKADEVAFVAGITRHGNWQALYYPQACKDKDGCLDGIMGNQDDNSKKVSTGYVHAADIGHIHAIDTYAKIPLDVRAPKPLKKSHLAGTDYAEAKDELGMCLVPTVGLGTFGMKAPTGKIDDEGMEDMLAGMSEEWAIYGHLLKTARDQADEPDIEKVLKNIENDKEATFSNYISPVYENCTFPATRPYFPIESSVSLALHPKAIERLEEFFKIPATPNDSQQQNQGQQDQQRDQQAQPRNRQLFPGASLDGNTIIFQSNVERENEREANLHLVSLALLFIVAKDVDFEKGTIGGWCLPTWSASFEKMVIKAAASVRCERLRALLMTIVNIKPTSRLEKLDPMFTHRSMKVFPKNLLNALLSCNIQTEPIISTLAESTSVNILHFGSQNRKDAVARAQDREKQEVANKFQGLDQSLQKNVKAELEVLSLIRGTSDLGAFPANFGILVSGMVDTKGGVPLFHLIQENWVDLLNDPKFKDWDEKFVGKQPQLPFTALNVHQHVLGKLGVQARNVLNVQAAEGGSLDLELFDPTEAEEAFKHYVRFINRIKNHIVDQTYDKVVVEMTPDDLNPNMDVRFGNLSIAAAPAPAAPASSSKTRKTTTPVASPTKGNERPAKRVKGEGKRAHTDLGFFHFKEGKLPPHLLASILPKHESEEKPLCANFCFQSNACKKKPQVCPFRSVSQWKKIKKDEQTLLYEACHNSEGKIWLDKATFEKQEVNVPNKYKYLLGDANGHPART